uniref:hypothetical protein n=1 Tax=Burkholderia sp. BCC1970 TaxID=2817437 RepID=UPI002ABE98E1
MGIPTAITNCTDFTINGSLNYCSNRSAPVVGSYGSSGQFVVMDAGGTMVEVSADTGLIYFRPGGATSGNSSGNVLTMATVSGGVLLNGVAAGTISATSTNAVNGSQLYTLSTSASTGISTAQSGVTSLSTGLS